MNKIIKSIIKVFKPFVKFIDKKIVLPITKIAVAISQKIKINGRGFERLLTKKPGLIIVSLLVATGLFLLADSKSTSLIETSAEVLYDQPISANYNEEAYVIEGLPETVDITLIGRRSDVYLAKQLPTNDIIIDLIGLKPGVHKVNLRYKKALSSVEYKLDPSVATIVIYEKKSLSKEINYEVINKDKINSKLMVEDVTLDISNVKVRGNDAMINDVASVKALIDLKELVDPTVGEQQLKNVKLVAYNNEGKKVDVEIVPANALATVKITSPKKDVPLKVIPKNYNPYDKAISNITTSISKVTIYGESSKLEKISYLPIEIDVSELKESKDYSITLTKPNGVRAMSENSVNVSIELGASTDKIFKDIYLEYENLGEGLIVQGISQASTKVSVIAKGVEKVLSGIDPSTIKAYLDLKDLGVGDHEIEVKVVGSDLRAKYKSETIKVPIRIRKKN